MRMGILTASMSRRAGGLFWSVNPLASGLRKAGCDVRVFAGRDAFSDQDKSSWGNTPLSLFPIHGPTAFGYQSGLSRALKADTLDLIHVHGLWMYPSIAATAWSRSGKPCIVSTHGMLDPWALKNSAWKKRLAGFLYENRHLRQAACIHALCNSEYEAIRAYGLANPVAVIPNGVDIPTQAQPLDKPVRSSNIPADSNVLLYLGRLHPKKGLEYLLQAWAKVKSGRHPIAEQWHLIVVGWQQGGYLANLEQIVRNLNIESTVHFEGPQFETAKDASFQRADAFILPSLSEGLPMVVLEAWSHGLPVLMTPQCNLPEGFRVGAAIRIEPEPDSIEEGLVKVISMMDDDRRKMGDRGRELVRDKFFWQKVCNDMFNVYQWVLGSGIKPECVRSD